MFKIIKDIIEADFESLIKNQDLLRKTIDKRLADIIQEEKQKVKDIETRD